MNSEDQAWVDEALVVWESQAPSYVQASVAPDLLLLRELARDGASVAQWEEALIHAFGSSAVTKRRAFVYAVGIVRAQLRGSNSG